MVRVPQHSKKEERLPFAATILPPSAVPPGPSVEISSKVSDSAGQMFELRYSATNIAFELRVNGVVVALAEEPGSPNGTSRIDQYLITGKNTLDLVISKKGGDLSEGKFELVRLASPEGSENRAEETLLIFEQKVGEPALAQRYVFEARSPYQLWQKTTPLKLDEATAREIATEALRAHRAFSKKDVAQLMPLLSFRAKEMGILVGAAESKAIEDQKAFLEMIFESAEFSVQPIKEEDLHLELVLDGHMVHVTRAGQPLLMSGQYGPGLDVFFGKIEGKYVVVR